MNLVEYSYCNSRTKFKKNERNSKIFILSLLKLDYKYFNFTISFKVRS